MTRQQFKTAQRVRAGDLSQTTLREDAYVVLEDIESDNVHFYVHGYGRGSTENPSLKFAELDLVASGNGTGSAGDAIEGELREVVYHDEEHERIKRVNGKYELDELRNPARSEGVPVPEASVGAREDEHVVLEVKTTSGSDGVELDPTASSGSIPYTQIEIAEMR